MKNITLFVFLNVFITFVNGCNQTNHEVNYFCVNCRRTCQTEAKNDGEQPIMGCGCSDGFIMDERSNECVALILAPKECNVTALDYNYGFIYLDDNTTSPATVEATKASTAQIVTTACTENASTAASRVTEKASPENVTAITSTATTKPPEPTTKLTVTTTTAAGINVTSTTKGTTPKAAVVTGKIAATTAAADSDTTSEETGKPTDFAGTVASFKPGSVNSTEDPGVIWEDSANGTIATNSTHNQTESAKVSNATTDKSTTMIANGDKQKTDEDEGNDDVEESDDVNEDDDEVTGNKTKPKA